MGDNMWIHVATFLPVILAVLFLCPRGKLVTLTDSVIIDKNIEEVFQFCKYPLNLISIQGSLSNLDVYDSDSFQDEKDGELEETFYVTAKQSFAFLPAVTYNFTKKSSSAKKIIRTEGSLLGISYSSVQKLVSLQKSQTEVMEVSDITMPWIWYVFTIHTTRDGHHKRLSSLKYQLEYGKS